MAIPPIEQKLKREKEFKRKKKKDRQILESLRKFKILYNYISIYIYGPRGKVLAGFTGSFYTPSSFSHSLIAGQKMFLKRLCYFVIVRLLDQSYIKLA